MQLKISFLLIIITLFTTNSKANKNLTDYVNTFIGTGGHGHTFPGATLPFGMVQLSPDTRLTGWDGCGGYHFTDSIVYGFSHTHLSGTGVSDYGDVLLMPFTGKTHFNNGADDKPGYRSKFSKASEKAAPGYYAVNLLDYNINVELTTTLRAGFHKYQFKSNDDKKVILDLAHRDMLTDSKIIEVDEYHINGYRYSKAWAEDQRIHFSIQFNQAIKSVEYNTDKTIAAINFGASKSEADKTLMAQVGISAVDIEGAEKNRKAELTDWNFESVKSKAQQTWEKELSKIKVSSNDEDKLVVFYSALYHTMIAPNLYTDVDGRYRGTDFKIHTAKDHTQYTIFSLWDTYRAAHPLYTIIDEKRTTDFIKTFIHQYEQGGQLPMWELANNYTGCMIGYHAVPVIADAYIKGITNFDAEKALIAMVDNATADKLGIVEYAENGFLPGELEAECVSKTLEYAYDDWTIAQMAAKMGKTDIASTYFLRAQNYKNVFDPETKFMRARLNNRWFFPFKPEEVNYNYTEANAWQYSYYVPQDVNGWMKMMGGDKALESKLDDLFSASSESSGRDQADITGLIGQYAHGNEPSHHIAYLYNFVGKANKTQKLSRQIMDELYTSKPDGYSGNEDCGQMSAWLVLSALGFYPVTPGSDEYIIGSPWFDKAEINLENGKTFTINAENNSDKNKYVSSLKVNNENYTKSYFSHSLIKDGATLNFVMTDKASDFGNNLKDRPTSEILGKQIVAVPAVISGDKAFFNSTKVVLETATEDADIYYSVNDDAEQKYRGPITLTDNTILKVRADKKGLHKSATVKSTFVKMEENRNIKLNTTYGNHYAAGGDKALIDYIRGGNDYRTGSWQGYEGVDIDAVVDLGEKKNISELSIGFLQDENSWIFMPTEVSFYVSNNGKKFKKAGSTSHNVSPIDKGSIIKDYTISTNAKARYIKVVANNLGVCPDYHKGAGGKCWIFADEIMIK